MKGEALLGIQTVIGAERKELLDQLAFAIDIASGRPRPFDLPLRTQDHKLLEIDALPGASLSQYPKRAGDRRRLGDRVAREAGGHGVMSVTP